jgi:hypothetical protein
MARRKSDQMRISWAWKVSPSRSTSSGWARAQRDCTTDISSMGTHTCSLDDSFTGTYGPGRAIIRMNIW